MTDENGDALIPLSWALYGPDGVFPDVRMREAKRVFGKVILRKTAYGKCRTAYVREIDFDRVRSNIT